MHYLYAACKRIGISFVFKTAGSWVVRSTVFGLWSVWIYVRRVIEPASKHVDGYPPTRPHDVTGSQSEQPPPWKPHNLYLFASRTANFKTTNTKVRHWMRPRASSIQLSLSQKKKKLLYRPIFILTYSVFLLQVSASSENLSLSELCMQQLPWFHYSKSTLLVIGICTYGNVPLGSIKCLEFHE